MALTEIPSELSSTPSIVDNGNATAITIDSSENATFAGNVGIGRSPRVMLDVAGEAAIAYNANYGLRFYNQPQNNWSSIGNNLTSAAANLVFKDSTGEVMRIESGNLLVGKATTAFGTAGLRFAPTGAIDATVSGDGSLFLNRLGSDGSIQYFYKDGAPVGSIGSIGGQYLNIGTGDAGFAFDDDNNTIVPWNPAANANTDATLSLGSGSQRFTDIYLSGGVNFSANANAGGMTSELLDDYETGTWTPTLAGYYGTYGTTFNQGTRSAEYTKVGNLVTLSMEISNAGVAASGNGDIIVITGLPFAIGSDCVGSHVHTSIASFAGGGWTSINTTQLGHLGNNGTASGVWTWLTGGNVATAGVAIRLTISYRH